MQINMQEIQKYKLTRQSWVEKAPFIVVVTKKRYS